MFGINKKIYYIIATVFFVIGFTLFILSYTNLSGEDSLSRLGGIALILFGIFISNVINNDGN